MRKPFRWGLWTGVGAVLALAGCAGTRPCPIIPMQLRLARYELEQLQSKVAAKQADVDRMRNGIEAAAVRLQQLEEEEDQLARLIEAARADTAGRKP